MRRLKRYSLAVTCIALMAILLTSCLNSAKSEPAIEGTRFMMDTVVSVKLLSGGSEAIMEAMFDKLGEIDQKMSRNYTSSDVSAINTNAGKQMVLVSDETKQVIEKSIEYSNLSQGYFDITFGPLINLWDIGSEQTKIPLETDIIKALSYINYKKITIEENKIKLNDEHMSIDLGGIAKGYAADKMGEIAKDLGVTSGIINIGGNILVIGSKVDSTKGAFSVGIQNPFGVRNGYLGIMNVENQTVVTSGNYERYFELDGKRYHHILNKDTGYPVDNGLAAVSIVTKSSIDADALSTVLYILGVEKGLELVESLEETECLFINNDKEVFLSSGMKDLFVLTDNQFTIVKSEGVNNEKN